MNGETRRRNWVTENSFPVGAKIGDLGLFAKDEDYPIGNECLFSDGMGSW